MYVMSLVAKWYSKSVEQVMERIEKLSSLSRDESMSISENTICGKRWMMAEGEYSVGYSVF